MKAIILCGEGEEGLAPLTLERPLPLLSLFDKPLLAHQAGLLRRHGVREIGVALPRLSRMVEDAMGDGEELGVLWDRNSKWDRPISPYVPGKPRPRYPIWNNYLGLARKLKEEMERDGCYPQK